MNWPNELWSTLRKAWDEDNWFAMAGALGGLAGLGYYAWMRSLLEPYHRISAALDLMSVKPQYALLPGALALGFLLLLAFYVASNPKLRTDPPKARFPCGAVKWAQRLILVPLVLAIAGSGYTLYLETRPLWPSGSESKTRVLILQPWNTNVSDYQRLLAQRQIANAFTYVLNTEFPDYAGRLIVATSDREINETGTGTGDGEAREIAKRKGAQLVVWGELFDNGKISHLRLSAPEGLAEAGPVLQGDFTCTELMQDQYSLGSAPALAASVSVARACMEGADHELAIRILLSARRTAEGDAKLFAQRALIDLYLGDCHLRSASAHQELARHYRRLYDRMNQPYQRNGRAVKPAAEEPRTAECFRKAAEYHGDAARHHLWTSVDYSGEVLSELGPSAPGGLDRYPQRRYLACSRLAECYARLAGDMPEQRALWDKATRCFELAAEVADTPSCEAEALTMKGLAFARKAMMEVPRVAAGAAPRSDAATRQLADAARQTAEEALREADAAFEAAYYRLDEPGVEGEPRGKGRATTLQYWFNVYYVHYLLSRITEPEGAARWLHEGKQATLDEAESLRPGSAAYQLACYYALTRRYAECKRSLNAALESDTPPSLDQVDEDADLEDFRDAEKAWLADFRDRLLTKGQPPSPPQVTWWRHVSETARAMVSRILPSSHN